MEGLNISHLESDRFKMNIHRGTLENINIKDLQKHIIDENVDLMIIRLPSKDKAAYTKLNNLGFEVIHADSLVHYTVNLAKHQIAAQRNDLQYEEITKVNIHFLKELVPLIFKDYQNHYYSNPFLNKDDILDGYFEWAASYALNEENEISWYVKREGSIVGFATCSFNDNSECEGVLYGVLPAYAGKGIYSDIIRFTQHYFKSKGFKRMTVSTQLQNYSVQKVWIREGFFLINAYETYHINSLLNFSINKKKRYNICITEDILEQFATFCGDKNKIHFDADYAKSMGFKGRIAHGMITQTFLSKIFGVDYPGEGTVFVSNNNLFLFPMYLNEEYVLEISTLQQSNSGFIKILAKITDEKNRVCSLSYNNLLHK